MLNASEISSCDVNSLIFTEEEAPVTHVMGLDGVNRNITGLGYGVDTISIDSREGIDIKTNSNILSRSFLNQKLRNAVLLLNPYDTMLDMERQVLL